MGWVYYKHAEVDRRHPRALAVCDRCGMVYNHSALRWQMDWMGAKMANLRILVCQSCWDEAQEQRRQIILPRDPIPIEQPRIEPAISEMGIALPGLDPSFQNSAIVLSSNNQIATVGGSVGNIERTVLGNTLLSGKVYWEVIWLADSNPHADGWGIGIANHSFSVANGHWTGIDQFSLGWFPDTTDGFLYSNGTSTIIAPLFNITAHVGDRLAIAVDATNKLIWLKNVTGGSAWNAGLANADPAAGINGIAIPFGAPFYPSFTVFTLASQAQSVFNADPSRIPVGYSLLPNLTIPYPYGNLPVPTFDLTTPVPANSIDPTAQNATVTRLSSYFSINQDLGHG